MVPQLYTIQFSQKFALTIKESYTCLVAVVGRESNDKYGMQSGIFSHIFHRGNIEMACGKDGDQVGILGEC